MRHAYITAALALATTAHAASFDCARVGSRVEATVCADGRLSRLDEVLAQDYQYTMASDIGDGARKDLKATQRAWVLSRNRCTDAECIRAAYAARIDQVCGSYPVLSGVSASCTSAEDALAGLGDSPTPAPSPYQAPPRQQLAPSQPANRPNGAPIDAVVRRHAQQVASLGFSQAQLQSRIYLKEDLVNPYQKYVTLEQYLALMYELPNVTKVATINAGGRNGFSVKVSGQPSAGFLFRFEGGEAFLSDMVKGDEATHLETADDEFQAALIFMQIANAAIERARQP
ncbi:lysozyme inhibitor LprI family protein [Paraburkholderia sediminicola]|uniref:lysozyme inhibitor LprI family protein n=1 Tax=Paraburkholderia sediminicola TaxID=458836 RepID=UPI0038B9179D